MNGSNLRCSMSGQKLDLSDFELETRYCKCNCGKYFRVLPSSPNFYSSVTHDPKHSWQFGGENNHKNARQSARIRWALHREEPQPEPLSVTDIRNYR